MIFERGFKVGSKHIVIFYDIANYAAVDVISMFISYIRSHVVFIAYYDLTWDIDAVELDILLPL